MKRIILLVIFILSINTYIFANEPKEINQLDTLWVCIAGFLVFFMNAGFAFLEAGFCRAKNVVNILSKNLLVFGFVALSFWLLGYSLMFSEGNQFIGGFKKVFFKSSDIVGTIPETCFFFFQVAFASAACSIISGAIAERIKIIAYIIFGFIISLIVYPIVGHWVWGGGWLANLNTPFFDFAGSTVVHSVGGWAALAGILILGPRLGKYFNNNEIKPIMGHNIPLSTLGCFILWLGWFGFNPGSELAFNQNVPYIALTTMLASCSATLSSTFTSWIFIGKPDLSMIINGCLAGLVAITAPCSIVTPVAAILIGIIAGIIVVFAVLFFDKIKIDDPVGALAVHLANGIWGTFSVGLFANSEKIKGLFYGGGFAQLFTQIIGIFSVGIFTFSFSLILWKMLSIILNGIRVTAKEEYIGLDIGEHSMEGYSGFQVFLNQ
ncbi:MAG TPA: ammonium transporter [bacterium]|nr:ammonium transporter [bacterium]HOL48465.1 ammonium transporter [bacterium]HPQ19824.1 ammonium transporter [bacterium]